MAGTHEGPDKRGSTAIVEPHEMGARLRALIPLRESQVVLLGVLIEKDESLAQMYGGALMARAAEDNPDFLSQACHSLRELIDNLPSYFAVPAKRTDSLGNRVRALRDVWNKESRVRRSNDDPLSDKFVARLTEFFEWHENEFSLRRELAVAAVRDLSASERRLPQTIEVMRADEWMAIRDWFIKKTHHGACTVDEFDEWLDVFEAFLLNLSKPRPFDNADIIDRLVRQGESGG